MTEAEHERAAKASELKKQLMDLELQPHGELAELHPNHLFNLGEKEAERIAALAVQVLYG